MNQTVVAQKLGAFVTPRYGIEQALAWALPFGGAGHAHMGRGEAQVALHKRRFSNGFQVKQARDGQSLAHQARGQITPHFFPVTAQQHGHQVSARRVANGADVAPVTTVLGDVPPDPGGGLGHLHGDVGNGDRLLGRAGTQRVIDHHHAGAHVVQGGGHKGVV